jgi:hypothetical protein
VAGVRRHSVFGLPLAALLPLAKRPPSARPSPLPTGLTVRLSLLPPDQMPVPCRRVLPPPRRRRGFHEHNLHRDGAVVSAVRADVCARRRVFAPPSAVAHAPIVRTPDP